MNNNDRTYHKSIFWDRINCCHHYSSLFVRRGDGTENILHSNEGVTQGDPQVMVAYRIGIIPLIKRLKLRYPETPHPWYTDNSGVLVMFDNWEKYFKSLKCDGRAKG